MTLPLSGLDHVLIGVRDLARAKTQYERLGFTVAPLGLHDNWGTANHCVMFEGDYLELIGVVDPAKPTNNLAAFLTQREGIMGVSYAMGDAKKAVRDLVARGVRAEGPQALGRKAPDGEGRLEFALARWPDEDSPGLPSFATQHLTPEKLRPKKLLPHANGAIGVIAVSVVVADPPSLVPAYERLFGAGSLVLTDETLTVHTGGTVMMFARPDDVGLLHPEIEAPDLAPPYALAVTLAVRDLKTVRAALKRNQAPILADRQESLTVAAEHACGAALEFTPVD